MIKSAVKNILGKIGYKLVPYNFNYPNDLRGIIDDPLRAKYYARTSSFLLSAPPEKCIILWRYNCSTKVGNPHVDTIIDYCKNNHATFEGSKMKQFYDSFQPQNVADLFNLKGKLSSELVDYPAYAMVLPWKNTDMKKKKNIVEKYVKDENKTRGRELSVKHGIQQFGPMSKEKGELEINTLIELTESIKQNGYSRSGKRYEDITSVVMVKDESYKYLIHDGTHRAAVLSALGYKDLPVRVEPSVIPAFIYRNEVEYWPKVRSRLYTVSQALQIFDTVYKGCGLGVQYLENESSMN